MDDSYRDIMRHLVLPKPGSGEIELALIAVLLLVLLLLAVGFLDSYLQRRRERSILLRSANKYHLTGTEKELLSDLAKSRRKVDPRKAFASARDFHRLFGPLMHELSGQAETDEASRIRLDGIFALRKKLFGEINHHFGSISSTIELKIGRSIDLQYSVDGRVAKARSLILDVDAAAITVANISRSGDYILFKKDDQFQVSFQRDDDGLYEFQTRALRDVDERSRTFLLLSHAKKLKRMQSRMFFRDTTRIQISYRKFAWNENPENRYRPGLDEPEQSREAVILDIGGGGLKISTDEALSRNDLLVFDLPLNRENTIKDLLAKVIRSERPHRESRYQVNLQYMNIKPAEQDILVRAIQQQKIEAAEPENP